MTARDRTVAPNVGPSGAFLSMADLLADGEPETTYLVDGCLPDGGTSLLVAKPKVGKSTLAQTLAFSVARGLPFLSRLVTRGPVLYLALEEKRSELRRHFVAMGATKDDDIAFFVARTPERGLDWLTSETEARRPALIIVDTLQRFARLRDLNDYAAVVNALDPLTNLARSSGAHLMLLHHGKKAGGSDGDAVLGSTGLFGAVDTLLELKKRDDGARIISSIQRYGENIEPTLITLDRETYAIHVDGTAAEADRRKAATAIRDFIADREEPPTHREVMEGVEGRRQVKIAALDQLVGEGSISRTGSGKKGDPYRFSDSVPGSHIVSGIAEPNCLSPANPHEIEDYSVPELSGNGKAPGTESDDGGTEPAIAAAEGFEW